MELEKKIDYDSLISENKVQIGIYEDQISKLIDSIKAINDYLTYIEEDYPNDSKFSVYGIIPGVWHGEHKDRYVNDIDMAYDTSINSFKNCIEQLVVI